MNETRGNSRTKPMRGGVKGGEINSLKDSEKTNEYDICMNCINTKYTSTGLICIKRNIYISPIMTCFITKCEYYEKN